MDRVRPSCIKMTFLVLLCILFLLFPVQASSKDRYVSERFIFLTKNENQPLILTLEFDRGLSPSSRKPFAAAFDGHLLYGGTWHHLKNGIYAEGSEHISPDQIPDFHPCILRWLIREEQVQFKGETITRRVLEGGAINYELQEVSLLLQFRNLRLLDEEGRVTGFTITTGIADAVLQFRGESFEGVLVYQKADFTGYNRFAYNVKRMRYRKFGRFFLLGENGDFYMLWREDEAKKIPGQWITPNKILIYEKEKDTIDGLKVKGTTSDEILTVRDTPKYGYGKLKVTWTNMREDSNPEAEFRKYPVSWKIEFDVTKKMTDTPNDNRTTVVKETIHLDTTREFYWFYRGLAGVRGEINGKKVFGLAETIRGK